MFFRRSNKSTELPLTTSFHHSAASATTNGSGKSIHIEAPIIRTIKGFSLVTRISYALLFGSFFLSLFGWRHLSYHSASIHLQCHFSGCGLHIKTPGNPKQKTILHRQQLLKTQHVRVASTGEIVKLVDDDDDQSAENKKRGEKIAEKIYNSHHHHHHTTHHGNAPPKKEYDGLYDSYTLVLRDYDPLTMGHMDEESIVEGKFQSVDLERQAVTLRHLLQSHGSTGLALSEDGGTYTLVMRQHNLNPRRGSARGQHSRLKNYIMKRRNKLVIREDRGPTPVGVLCLVFGIFGFLLTLLLGEFWEEEKAVSKGKSGGKRYGGARESVSGVRRREAPLRKSGGGGGGHLTSSMRQRQQQVASSMSNATANSRLGEAYAFR